MGSMVDNMARRCAFYAATEIWDVSLHGEKPAGSSIEELERLHNDHDPANTRRDHEWNGRKGVVRIYSS